MSKGRRNIRSPRLTTSQRPRSAAASTAHRRGISIWYPSFKFRHEVREPLENGDTSYYRAYPQFLPRRVSTRRARRQAIRHGG